MRAIAVTILALMLAGCSTPEVLAPKTEQLILTVDAKLLEPVDGLIPIESIPLPQDLPQGK